MRPDRRGRSSAHSTEIALTNFGLTFAKCLLALSVVLFALMGETKSREEGVRPKAEFVISMSWPGHMDYDVDIFVMSPTREVVYFGHREGALMTLDRDDLGTVSDQTMIAGRLVSMPINEETVAIRGIIPGEYAISVLLYAVKTPRRPDNRVEPAPVIVRLTKINPTVQIVWQGDVVLERVSQEKHVMHFTLDGSGTVTDVSTAPIPVSLVQSAKGRR